MSSKTFQTPILLFTNTAGRRGQGSPTGVAGALRAFSTPPASGADTWHDLRRQASPSQGLQAKPRAGDLGATRVWRRPAQPAGWSSAPPVGAAERNHHWSAMEAPAGQPEVAAGRPGTRQIVNGGKASGFALHRQRELDGFAI